MPKETRYVRQLAPGLVRMRVRFGTSGTSVISILVQLEAIHDGEWKAARRYDDSHGQPHLDFLDTRGREYRKVWLGDDRNTVLNLAIRDFYENWRVYVAEFLNDGAE